MSSPLRLFNPDPNHHPVEACSATAVAVRLGDLLPLLLDAASKNHAWVRDFYDDNVEIPQDLYEVILAYRQQTRLSA